MKLYEVPNILIEKVDKINFIYYENENPFEKNKVLFSQNVISFVIEGEKEIYFSNTPVKVRNSIALIKSSNCLMSERRTKNDKPYSALLIFFDNSVLSGFKVKYQKKIEKNISNTLKVNVVMNNEFLVMYRDFLVKILTSNKIFLRKN